MFLSSCGRMLTKIGGNQAEGIPDLPIQSRMRISNRKLKKINDEIVKHIRKIQNFLCVPMILLLFFVFSYFFEVSNILKWSLFQRLPARISFCQRAVILTLRLAFTGIKYGDIVAPLPSSAVSSIDNLLTAPGLSLLPAGRSNYSSTFQETKVSGENSSRSSSS